MTTRDMHRTDVEMGVWNRCANGEYLYRDSEYKTVCPDFYANVKEVLFDEPPFDLDAMPLGYYQEPYSTGLSPNFILTRNLFFVACMMVLLCFGFSIGLTSIAKLRQEPPNLLAVSIDGKKRASNPGGTMSPGEV